MFCILVINRNAKKKKAKNTNRQHSCGRSVKGLSGCHSVIKIYRIKLGLFLIIRLLFEE